MAVLSCIVSGRVVLVEPWLRSWWMPDTQNKHGGDHGITWGVIIKCQSFTEMLFEVANTMVCLFSFEALNVRLAFTAPRDLHFRHLSCMHVLGPKTTFTDSRCSARLSHSSNCFSPLQTLIPSSPPCLCCVSGFIESVTIVPRDPLVQSRCTKEQPYARAK